MPSNEVAIAAQFNRSLAQHLALGAQSVRVPHDFIVCAARNPIQMRARCDCAAVSDHRCSNCSRSGASHVLTHLVRGTESMAQNMRVVRLLRL